MYSVCRVLLALFCVALLGHAALVPPLYINSVVAIGHSEPSPGGTGAWVTEASGFFYGYLVQDDPEPAKRRYEIYLITNKHVIQNRAEVFIRLNPKQQSDQGQIFNLPMTTWFTHKEPDIDIAGTRVNWQLLQERGIDVDFMTSDMHAADTKKMSDIGVSAGDAIFVLGFPMNLAGRQRSYVIVRPRAIARISDLIQSASEDLLIDAHVFPGNSGGPVILEPSAVVINGTKSNNTAYLIGVVKAYIPYIDVAISPQTQRARVTFEENSGLAEVVPIDRINEAIKAWRDSRSPSPPAPLKFAPEKQ